MAIDQTPGVVVVPARDEIRDRYTKDYQLRVPSADVGPDTQPYVDASLVADAQAPVYANAVTIGRGTLLSTSAGDWLKQMGADVGVYPRPAVGASGFVTIVAASGGTFIQAGTELKTKVTAKRYKVTFSALYQNGDPAPVEGIDTGPSTNVTAGTVLVFTAPPPGCGPNATVLAKSDGTGLTGGRNADDDRALRALISDVRANPPASGNDAQYQQTIRVTPSLSIQQVFTYPAILGPGTIAVVFTLHPSRVGGSRAPSAAQTALAEAYVKGLMPADDSLFMAELVEFPMRVCLRVQWAPSAPTWIDASPWPAYVTNDPVRVATLPPPSANTFRLFTTTTTTNPQVGQTIGFYDPTSGVFKRIRIGAVSTVTAGKTWDITVDRTYNASDPNFLPGPGDVASPWSESLSLVSPAVLSYMDGLGPGEQVATLPDPELRQRRQPPSPTKWPSVFDNRVLTPVQAVAAVQSAVVLEPAVPYQTPVGAATVLSNLLTLGDLALFP